MALADLKKWQGAILWYFAVFSNLHRVESHSGGKLARDKGVDF
jgi:hypothetical protein